MQIAIRADSSKIIGTGHIMRCMTLAHALKNEGYFVTFYSRAHEGNLNNWLANQGMDVRIIPAGSNSIDQYSTAHGSWLGATQAEDIQATLNIINTVPDLWIVDHYGLDHVWHKAMATRSQVMVIDDLADRRYDACLLLDQNLGRKESDYAQLTNAKILAGVDYTLLRPEFIEQRQKASIRQGIKNIVISMGGVDLQNVSGIAFRTLLNSHLHELESITVVLGHANPHRADMQLLASQATHIQVEVVQGVSNMAEYFARADLCIGAAGATSWERCAVGLPTVLVQLAANQQIAAQQLTKVGAALSLDIGQLESHLEPVVKELANNSDKLMGMSRLAFSLIDAEGTTRVVKEIKSLFA
ncbi:UDP-2,4-diacetamido-2,4,6-trideoxy-beta-L-altropyranose hydrolase [Aliidiomarina taiwanensis]|uniref:UDP-2,4-diacetamido-2,4, 6-trideoxy-beta-L-altropyranose hydrolase n=1 Tax=Aliidiomarina taiwanensis TaxID=946228 RepID=A0A432X8M7_9GAMM|nr:UDP-2,4-diacetamido-2,4,6-trideoxy-beta-L-altropyranose hydrolase [Aliidiomarina taiwanensis]RUO43775.1 UDP-2,4-diacetamido-2,4,6-trideoxy-beta-L-altropyranose hydrolase [Aliidiomarina taiwanensis]